MSDASGYPDMVLVCGERCSAMNYSFLIDEKEETAALVSRNTLRNRI